MAVLEYDRVEVDYCVSCHGIWLDAGELELLYGDAAACAKLLAGDDPARAKPEDPRACPICRKKMRKDVSGGNTPVTYDRCPNGDGLWFDEGELAAILKHGEAFAESEIGAFLSEVFGGVVEDAPDKDATN
jgi:Zn-finger nucleic acid-binding protein